MRLKHSSETWHPRDRAPAFDRARYPEPLIARVSAAWRRLCEDERESVIAAALVTTDLARLGAPAAILAMAARVIEDEIRHVEVCTRVLDSLGTRATVPEPEATRATLDREGEGEGEGIEFRVARELITRFAVGRSLSAACFATARATAREPIIAWAYTELLRDEARHGAFGARAGAWVIRRWSPQQRQALWSDCLMEMESFERRVGGPFMSAAKYPPRRDSAAAALGLLTPEASCSAVSASIPRWVLPHLATLGVVPPPSEAPSLLQ
jgi:hypothetical protein